jgi:hypothetical protein
MEIVTCIAIGVRDSKQVHCESFVTVKCAIVSSNDLESRSSLSTMC